jgi:hypothetical protein
LRLPSSVCPTHFPVTQDRNPEMLLWCVCAANWQLLTTSGSSSRSSSPTTVKNSPERTSRKATLATNLARSPHDPCRTKGVESCLDALQVD